MSSISDYKETLFKFKESSKILEKIKIPEHNKNDIDQSYIGLDSYVSIIIVSILNSLLKANKMYFHAKYIAQLINFINILCNKKQNDQHNDHYNDNNIVNILLELINITFYENTEIFKSTCHPNVSKDINNNALLIFEKYMNLIRSDIPIYNLNKTKKTDIMELLDVNQIEHYKQINILNEASLLEYTDLYYGNMCKLGFILAWIFGGSSTEKHLKILENMGQNCGIIIKVLHDYDNLYNNLHSRISYNTIITLGVKKTYNLFMKAKTNFIMCLLKLNLYNNKIIKWIIQEIENKMDEHLEKSNDLDENISFVDFD